MIREKELFSEEEWSHAARELALSPRQAEIMRCVVLGKSDKEIASELGIALPTVRTHMRRLFQKLQLSDRLELVLLVLTCLRGRVRAGPQYLRKS